MPDPILVARYSGTMRMGLKPPGAHWLEKTRTPAGRESFVDRGPQTWDWNYPKGHPENTYGLKARDEVVDWHTALPEVYPDDRYFTPAVLYGPDGKPLICQPRLTLPALPWLKEKGYTVRIRVLAADVDCAGHRAWTPEGRDQWAGIMSRLPANVGCYETMKGARPWVVTDRDVSPEELGGGWIESGRIVLRGILGGFFEMLLDAGLAYEKNDTKPYLDVKCHDFYRAYRLPNVPREDGTGATFNYRSPPFKVDVEPMPPPMASALTTRRVFVPSNGDPSKSFVGIAFAHAGMLGNIFSEGKAMAECPFAGGHSTGRSGADTSSIIFAASSSSPHGWFYCSHASCADRSQGDYLDALPAEALKAALDEFEITRAEIAEPLPSSKCANDTIAEIPSEEASGQILALLLRLRSDKVQPGPYLIEAACGAGKGWSTRMVAQARAAILRTGKRAPKHSRTVILLPTIELCKQFKDELDAWGVPCFRDRGTVDKDHIHLCMYPDKAKILSESGVSVRETLCNGCGIEKFACSYRETCGAYNALYGDPNAAVVVAPHSLAYRYAGRPECDLIVIDEPPPLILTTRIPLEEMRGTRAVLRSFTRGHVALMAPILGGAIAYTEETFPEDRATSKPEDLLAALRSRLPEETIEAATQALADHMEAHPDAYAGAPEGDEIIKSFAKAAGANPRISPNEVDKIRNHKDTTSTIAAAAKVLRALAVAVATPHLAMVEVAITVRGRRTSKELILTHVNPLVYVLAMRVAPTAWTDAGISMNLATYQGIVGSFANLSDPKADPKRMTVLNVADGAEGTERTLLLTKHATRSSLLLGGKPNVAAIVSGLRLIAGWVREDPNTKEVLIGTFKAVKDFIEAARKSDDPTTEPIRAALALFPKPPAFCHYGGVRGLNKWEGADGKIVEFHQVDAVATLGDHRQDFNQVERELAGLTDLDAAVRERAAAEHEQVHGRARDPQRDRPARHAHVGEIAPRDWTLTGPKSHSRRPVWFSVGKVARSAGMTAAELRGLVNAFGGTSSEFCAVAKVKKESLSKYLSGERTIDADTAAAIRAVEPLSPEMRTRVTPAEAQAVIERGGGCQMLADRLGHAWSTMEKYQSGEKTMPRALYEKALRWVNARPSAA